MVPETRLSIPILRSDGLQLDEDRALQRRYWRIQRIAWWGFGLIMLLAVLGFSGSGGMFQKQTVSFKDAVVEAPRVSRWEGSDDLTIRFGDAAPTHSVTLSQPFFDRFTLERIQPEPAENRLLPGSQSMTFPAAGPAPHVVKFDMRAMHFGWTSFDLTIAGETRRINLIVLP